MQSNDACSFFGVVSAIIATVQLNQPTQGSRHKKDETWQTRFSVNYTHNDVMMSITYRIFLCDIT